MKKNRTLGVRGSVHQCSCTTLNENIYLFVLLQFFPRTSLGPTSISLPGPSELPYSAFIRFMHTRTRKWSAAYAHAKKHVRTRILFIHVGHLCLWSLIFLNNKCFLAHGCVTVLSDLFGSMNDAGLSKDLFVKTNQNPVF